MVGTVFVYSPALILGGMTAPNVDAKTFHIMIWIAIIFAYYILATMLPIDKIIGKIYPIFAFALLYTARHEWALCSVESAYGSASNSDKETGEDCRTVKVGS